MSRQSRNKSKKNAVQNPAQSINQLNRWEVLHGLISNLVEAARADETKGGGGDPADMQIKVLELRIAYLRLNHHITSMERDLEDYG